MRLLHVLNNPKIGGLERLVVNLAIWQKKGGMNVSIMLDSTTGQYYSEIVENCIPIILSRVKGGYDFNYSNLIRLKLNFSDFDIIHFHSYSTIKGLAANLSSAKVMYTIHGLSKGVRSENYFKYYIRESLKKIFLNKVDLFIANSDYTLYKAKAHYGLSRTSCKTIYNGIPLTQIQPRWPTRHEVFTIGLVSRFTKRKRVDRLLFAFKEFLNLGGDGMLVLVGDGEERKKIEMLIKKLKLEGKVQLTGYQNQVHAYYDKFDICVQPSDNEGFGLVAVESYLHGRPIIGFSDSGGLQEIISSLEPKDVVQSIDDFAKRILYYWDNKDMVKYGADLRISYAMNKYSLKRMADDYLSCYNTLL